MYLNSPDCLHTSCCGGSFRWLFAHLLHSFVRIGDVYVCVCTEQTEIQQLAKQLESMRKQLEMEKQLRMEAEQRSGHASARPPPASTAAVDARALLASESSQLSVSEISVNIRHSGHSLRPAGSPARTAAVAVDGNGNLPPIPVFSLSDGSSVLEEPPQRRVFLSDIDGGTLRLGLLL